MTMTPPVCLPTRVCAGVAVKPVGPTAAAAIPELLCGANLMRAPATGPPGTAKHSHARVST